MCMFPAEAKEGDVCCLFQLLDCKLVGIFLWSNLVPCFFHIFLGNVTFYKAPKHSDKVSSSVPKHKAAVMYLMEKITMLDKLHSDLSWVPLAMRPMSVNWYVLNKGH